MTKPMQPSQREDERHRLVLASSSAERRRLLSEAGYRFEVIEPGGEEDFGHDNPRQLAERLAYFKARRVADRVPSGLVLGADTICLLGEQVIGKPTDEDDARRILRTLAGTRHRVITGLCLLEASSGVRIVGSEVTWVTMRPMSDQEIEDYVASGAGWGKAGAYAVQPENDPYVERIEGSISNVLGLPMELFERMLRAIKHL